MIKFVNNVLRSQYLIKIAVIERLHFRGEPDTVAHRIDFVLKLKLHFPQVVVFLIDILLRANLLNSLRILKDGLYDLLIVLQPLLRQRNINIEVGIAPEFVIAAGRKLVGEAL